MDLTAESAIVQLARLKWDLFGTLTFRQAPRPRSALGLVWRHMGHAARFGGQSYSRLLIAIREERGGVGGRLHFHYLLGGLQGNLMTLAKRLEHDWRFAGFAEVRPFDNAQQGVSYVVKTLGVRDSYELDRFGRVSSRWDRVQLTLSRSVGRVIRSLDQMRANGACCTTAKTGECRALPAAWIQNPIALASSLHGGQGIPLV